MNRGAKLEWVNRFLDMQCVREWRRYPCAPTPNTLSIRSLVVCRPGVDVMHLGRAVHRIDLGDYVRDQLDEQPTLAGKYQTNVLPGAAIVRFHFHRTCPCALSLIQRTWYPARHWLWPGRLAAATADLKLKVRQRVIVPLAAEQVAHFWRSFRTARDLAWWL